MSYCECDAAKRVAETETLLRGELSIAHRAVAHHIEAASAWGKDTPEHRHHQARLADNQAHADFLVIVLASLGALASQRVCADTETP